MRQNELLSIGCYIDILNHAFSQTKGKETLMEIRKWWKGKQKAATYAASRMARAFWNSRSSNMINGSI